MNVADIAKRFRIDQPDRFRLSEHNAADMRGLSFGKGDGKDMLADWVEQLAALQEKLYASQRWSVLVVLQGMDAAGKDGVISRVMAEVNLQGCEVHPFKAPNDEELAHDFLWRAVKRLPGKGRIGIFNRSYYEEVIVTRVHPEFLERQKLPPTVIGADLWEQRFDAIRAFERHLVDSGTCVLKFFLNLSREQQRQRFLDRASQPDKQWKFSMGDVAERALWPKYMDAYEQMIRATSTVDAPWFVVPADHKWFTRLVVAAAMVDRLNRLGLAFPKLDGAAQKQQEEARKALEGEKPGK